jgi:hypothetical protein
VSVPSPATSKTCYDLRDSAAARCCTSASRPAFGYITATHESTVHSNSGTFTRSTSNSAFFACRHRLLRVRQRGSEGKNSAIYDRQPFDLLQLPCTRILRFSCTPPFDVFCSSLFPAPMAIAFLSFFLPSDRGWVFFSYVVFFLLLTARSLNLWGRKIQTQIRAMRTGWDGNGIYGKINAKDYLALYLSFLLSTLSFFTVAVVGGRLKSLRKPCWSSSSSFLL